MIILGFINTNVYVCLFISSNIFINIFKFFIVVKNNFFRFLFIHIFINSLIYVDTYI